MATEVAKDRIQEELGNILAWAKDVGDTIGEAVQTQAPQLVEEMLKFAIIDYTMEVMTYGIILAAILIVWYKIVVHANKKKEDDWDEFDYNFTMVLSSVIGGIFSIALFYSIVLSINHILKVLIAPRLYIIEKLATLF